MNTLYRIRTKILRWLILFTNKIQQFVFFIFDVLKGKMENLPEVVDGTVEVVVSVLRRSIRSRLDISHLKSIVFQSIARSKFDTELTLQLQMRIPWFCSTIIA